MILWLSGVLLTASALLGGGSRAGFLGDVYVQLLAVPLLLASLWALAEKYPDFTDFRAAVLERRSPDSLLMLAALVALCLPLVQLLSLPTLLGRDWALSDAPASILGGTQADGVWRGFSVTSDATWSAVVSIIPAIAIFAGVSQLDAVSRLRLTGVVIALGTLGLVIGFLQIAQGPQSGLRFFAITNPTEAVGFFANRNHFAAQIYTTLVFAAVWFAFTVRNAAGATLRDSRALLWLAVALVLLITALAGITLARSRAGLLLAFAAIAGIVAMIFAGTRSSQDGRRASSRRSSRRIAMAALGVAVLFAAQFGMQRIMSRFENDPMEDLRWPLASVTLRAALDNLPFGTGFGSFIPVYASLERPEDMSVAYANRAHNDWAEFLLEAGLPGAAIAALFLWWLVAKAMAIWRPGAAEPEDDHAMLQRGATVVIALLLVHSLLDYPLRTTAMATLFAFACALLIDPPFRAVPVEAAPPPAKHKRRKRQPLFSPETPRDTWGEDVHWPDEWRR
jgi:O-antigen ligase